MIRVFLLFFDSSFYNVLWNSQKQQFIRIEMDCFRQRSIFIQIYVILLLIWSLVVLFFLDQKLDCCWWIRKRWIHVWCFV